MSYMLWKDEIIFVSHDEIGVEMNVPETVQLIKKVSILRKNTKAAKSTKVHFIREILWPEQESGRDSALSRRPPNNPQDLAHMRSVTYS